MSAPGVRTEYVTSDDGTRIGYLRQGRGAGVVLVQGAMADAWAYSRLARHMSHAHTVHSADRRGRSLSPFPYSADHDIARDVEDIDAILAATGASTVFGLSSGAVITLEAARTLPRVKRAIVFEPPFYEHGIDRAGIDRLNSEIQHGDSASALLDALLVAGTAPAVLSRAPRPLTRAIARTVLALNLRTSGSSTGLRDLLPSVRFDFHDVAQADGTMKQYQTLAKPVLVLSGTKSPPFLRQAADDLAQLLPQAEHVHLPGLGHDGPWNSGQPQATAEAVLSFMRRTHAGTTRT